MSVIDKILNKVNKAKSAINSIKGIQSKIKSLNYNSVIDALGEEAREARDSLNERRQDLERQIQNSSSSKGFSKKSPATKFVDLQYPDQDLDNWLVFTTRPRKSREGREGTVRSGRNKNLLSSEEQVEIKLYIPDSLISQSNVSYKSQGISGAKRGVADIISKVGNGIKGDAMEAFGQESVSAVASGIIKGMDKLTGGFTNVSRGRAINPMQEQLLDGVGFRSFNFTYDFYPKSRKEADAVNRIIFAFRTAMLPDTFAAEDGGGVENFFNMPNIFDVEFDGPIAEKVDGFLPMVCAKCDVDHTGGQKFSTFIDGQPIKSTITMEFLEIKILTQENYLSISPFKDSLSDFNVDYSNQDIEQNSSILDEVRNDGTGG